MAADSRGHVARRVFRAGAGLVVAGVLGALFVRDISGVDLERTLAHVAPGWVAVAFLAMAANILFGAARWVWLLRGSGHRIPLVRGTPPAVVARAANDVLPLRGGDVLRAVAAQRAFAVPLGVSAGVFSVERLLDGLSLGVLLVAGAWASRASAAWLATGAALLAGSAVGLIGAGVAARTAAPSWFVRPVRVLPARLRPAAARFLDDTVRGARALGSPSGAAVALALSLGMWGLEWAMFLTAAWSVHLHLPRGSYALIQGAANLGLAVPTSPAGAGTFDYVALQAARSAHASPALVGGYVLVAHAVLVLASVALALPLLLPALRTAGRRRARAGRVDPGSLRG